MTSIDFWPEGTKPTAFCIWHALNPPGGGPPPHIHHRENEGFYVLKGELTFYALDVNQVVKAGPGTFVHLPPDRPHRFANESSQEVEALIMTAPAGIEKMFLRIGTPSLSAKTVHGRSDSEQIWR